MVLRSLSQDLGIDSPKLTLGKICKCEIIDKTGRIIFTGSGDKPESAIEECYKDLLSYLAIKFWE